MPSYNKSYHTTTSPGLKSKQGAQARHLSYKLLSHLFLKGVTKDVLSTVRAASALAEHLPEPIDPDEMAAAHYQLFGFDVFPFESIFLDNSGLLGGPVTDALTLYYQRAGAGIEAGALSPDHIGQELAFLSLLCQLELRHLREDTGDAASARLQQIDFLQKHLLCWLPPLWLAVKQQGDGFFTAVTRLTLELIYDHYQTLMREFESPVAPRELPDPPPLLEDDKTGLKELAAYFTIPASSGIYMSREDVGRLARWLDLPRGFGDRQQLLTNLMRTAVHYDQVPALLQALEVLVSEWQMSYQAQCADRPLLDPFCSPWIERTAHTINLLESIQTKIESLNEAN